MMAPVQQPVRATATLIGVTVFQQRPAVLEWYPEGRFRVVALDAAGPQVLFDGPPQAMKRVTRSTAGQEFIVFFPQQGKRIRTDLSTSHLPALPGEPLDAWAARAAATPVPPPAWWVDVLAAHGVKARTLGWGFVTLVALGTVIGVAAVSLLVYALEQLTG